jgi:hypothetical protein
MVIISNPLRDGNTRNITTMNVISCGKKIPFVPIFTISNHDGTLQIGGSRVPNGDKKFGVYLKFTNHGHDFDHFRRDR